MTGATALQKAAPCGGINQIDRQEFLSLYLNRAQHIYKAPGDPNWKVSRFKLATGLIDAAISAECDTFYGAFWGTETEFAVIDIDTDSKYHNAQELQNLREDLATIGLSGNCLYQSSKSNGWHLYLPLADPAPSKELERALKAWLKQKGYDITCGQLEVFPSGNALRLPLQRGFAWLDDDGTVVIRREQLALEEAVSRFLDDFRKNVNNWDHAKSLINSQLEAMPAAAGGAGDEHEKAISAEGFDDLFSYRVIHQNYDKGRSYWHNGLTEKNQRHEAILCVEHYLWHGDQMAGIPAYPGRFNDRTRARLIRAWLEEKHNGYSGHVSSGNWRTIEADIERAVTWRGDGKAVAQEPYLCTERAQEVLIARSMRTGRAWTMDDLKKGNDKRQRLARRKIRRAVAAMTAAGQQLTRNGIAERSRCSPNTVSKHRDLWTLLATGSGDQSRGVQGGLVLSPGSLVQKEKREIKLIQSESENSDLGNQIIDFPKIEETVKDTNNSGVFKIGKTLFILPYGPYGSSRRPCSDSVPLRRLCSAEVLAAASSEGIKKSRRHDSTARSKNAASRTVQAVYGTDLGLISALADVTENDAPSIYRFLIDTGE